MGDKIESQVLAEEIINKAIQEVVFKYNAFAPIISSFRIAYTDIIPTMGVDRYARLIVNPEFAVKNQMYMKGIIIHEVLHVFFGHTNDTRSKLAYTDDKDMNDIINIAEDCAINQFITEDLPDWVVKPPVLKEALGLNDIQWNQQAEYYYDLIMENLKKKGGQGGKDQNKTEELVKGACSTGDANTSKVQDELDKMGIEHISQEEVNDSVLSAAKEISKSQGHQYGSLVAFAKELLEPKVDWKPLLQATIRNAEKKIWTIHSRQTYKRISRRSNTVLIPKRYGQKVSVTLSFDTSGSISSEMVNQFLSEIKSCMRYSEIKECALWHTSNYWYGTPEQLEKDVEKIFQSGGTSSVCVEEAAKHCKADLGFTFTDGYWGDDPQKPEGCKVKSMNAIIWDGNDIKEIRKLW